MAPLGSAAKLILCAAAPPDPRGDSPARPSAVSLPGHGMKFGIARGRNPVRRNGLQLQEQPRNVRGARRRKLPVGVELRVVDGNIVGVALDAQVVRRRAQPLGDLASTSAGLRLGRGRAGIEESRFAQADHQPIAAHLEETVCEAICLASVCCQIRANAVKIVLHLASA